MKKIILVLFLYLLSTVNSEAQWIKQFSPNNDFRDIEFINRDTGWACGDNFIYKTTNGGISWIEQSHPNAFLIQQIFPVNANVVYACGWWNFMKTTNGGENWTAFFAGSSGQGLPELEALYFINENTGWLAGSVVAMKTTNGGVSFIDSMRVEALAQDLYFKDSLNGIMCGESAGFFKTTNGGQNWNSIPIITKGPLYSFYRISVLNDSIVWLASKSVYRSSDFGNTWDSLTLIPMSNPNRSIFCMKFTSPMIGYAGGQQLELFKTTNGGYDWFNQQTSQFLVGIYFGLYAYNDSIIWASGRNIILNTISGGTVDVLNTFSVLPSDYIMYQNYPNPFNPNTKIKYEIKKSGTVIISIFDIKGNLIKNLINENKYSGIHFVEFNGENLTSGIYLYTLKINNIKIDSKKMLLIK